MNNNENEAMNAPRNQFLQMLDDLIRETGLKPVATDDPNTCILPLEGGAVEVNVSYRPATSLVVTSAVVGPFLPSVDEEGRARTLLELNWQWAESRGFTVAVDDATASLIVVDRRPALRFVSPDSIWNYLVSAAELVRGIRAGIVEFEECAERLAEEAAEAEGKEN